MKAISIRQPWAWAIIHAGKRVENRSWGTEYRGPVLIHAAKGMSWGEYDAFRDFYKVAIVAKHLELPEPPTFAELPRGGVIGRARIIGCVHETDKRLLHTDDKPWFFGPNGFILDSVEPIPFIPYRGALGLFDVPDDAIPETAA
jgi:hypothetical protein